MLISFQFKKTLREDSARCHLKDSVFNSTCYMLPEGSRVREKFLNTRPPNTLWIEVILCIQPIDGASLFILTFVDDSNIVFPYSILSWLRSSLSFPASQAVSGGFWSLTMTPIIQLLNLYATLTLLHQRAWALRHFMDEREDYLEAEGCTYPSTMAARVRAHLDSLIS